MTKPRVFKGAAIASALAAILSTQASAQTPVSNDNVQAMIRYPAVHGDEVVFEAGGHLWRSAVSGGQAVQLTSDSGYDSAPHFSPDGKWIAFTGWYQGNTDVYVIPAMGGAVKRLTYHSINSKIGKDQLKPSPDNTVLGWTPDGKDVVFLSRRDSFNPQVMHAFKVPVGGGLPEELPLPWTGPLSFASNGHEVAYNKLSRVYRPFHRKHYYGGQAQDIWTYNFNTGKTEQITHWKGADVWPMWHGKTLYFTSDRGEHGVQNLWSYSMTSQHFTQLTHFDTYDIDAPTLGDNAIAFSDGGKLYVYQLGDNKLQQVKVTVPLDGTRTQPHWVDASQQIASASVAPDGKLAVFSARGALFTVPAKYGSIQTLTQDPAADERHPAWSPDGKHIAYIYAKGEQSEIAIRSADGGAPKLLTHSHDISYQGPVTWSPDSKWITYVDSNQNLWLQNIADGKRYKVATDNSSRFTFTDLAWAPGSDWLTFSKTLETRKSGLFLYNVKAHQLHSVSDGRFSDFSPYFSDNGKYLYFASNRVVNPTMSNFDETMASLNSSGLYATTLDNDTVSPIAPRQPKPVADSDKKDDKKDKDKGKEKSKALHIDLNGLMSRAVRLPVPDTNISGVFAAKGVVFYLTQPNMNLAGPLTGEAPELRAYSLEKRKDKTLVKDVNSAELSADHSTLFYQAAGKWQLRPASFDEHADADTLNLAHMRRWVEPHAEWATIFNEAWRDVRDYFLNPELIKSDWASIGEHYRKLLPMAASRDDVNWLIANMIGTPGESHMYVFGGDQGWKSPATTTADLGAEFALDKASGRYKLAKIYKGDNTVPGYESPLGQPGLKVAEGDYILAINGQPLKAPTNPYALLNGTFGSTVQLRLSQHASGKDAWTISVNPVANGNNLRLEAWIAHNREVVNKASGGKIGYVYLKDMETEGMQEFVRQYYSQTHKEAIIFDDRWNLGGFIDPFIFDRIHRQMAGMFTNRYGWADPTPNAFNGYMAALINRGSASDGDIFAYMFKVDHLGPTIGSRTWAGVRGLDGPFPLMDGGSLVVSDNGMYGNNGKWIVENIGVSPDVTVHDEAGDLNRGVDAQLDTAIKMMMHNIAKTPRHLPPTPAWTPAFPPQPAYPKCSDHHNDSTCS
ncbi:S41 family peptidase [Gallaecimonas mangrovi]|uniref:S41 family peptidase n=1 Tax=Gallaecimonas mangrovi TaxID=2291597 RepID=UPI000E2003EE|nr:S41 family peptidase [Gallaecimonas mangrovi]